MAEAHALSRKQQREADAKLVADLELQKKALEEEIERVCPSHPSRKVVCRNEQRNSAFLCEAKRQHPRMRTQVDVAYVADTAQKAVQRPPIWSLLAS